MPVQALFGIAFETHLERNGKRKDSRKQYIQCAWICNCRLPTSRFFVCLIYWIGYTDAMGIDILSFVDTDLNDLDADTLHRTLEQRIGEKIQLRGFEGSPYPFYGENEYGWSLFCEDANLEDAVKSRHLNLRKETPDCTIELLYYNNTFMIEDLIVGKENYNSMKCYRFNGFCRMLSENPETILGHLKHCIEMIKQYISPITHSTRLFLCGDQEYNHNKELLAEQFEENGFSIDQAISYKASSVDPDTLYTWDNLESLMKDYTGWGIFDFKLDKLPEYISSIH